MFNKMFVIAINEHYYETVSIFLKNINIHVNKGPTEGPNKGMPWLVIAAYKGHTDIVKLLLEQPNINVNQAITEGSSKGSTLLLFAVAIGHANVVKLLLKHSNIDMSRFSNKGANAENRTPLLWLAAQKGRTKIANLLLYSYLQFSFYGLGQLEHDMKSEVSRYPRAQPFLDLVRTYKSIFSFKQNSAEIITCLKKLPPEDRPIDLSDQQKNTLLHEAVKRLIKIKKGAAIDNEQVNLIEHLVEQGIDVERTNLNGKSALDILRTAKKTFPASIKNKIVALLSSSLEEFLLAKFFKHEAYPIIIDLLKGQCILASKTKLSSRAQGGEFKCSTTAEFLNLFFRKLDIMREMSLDNKEIGLYLETHNKVARLYQAADDFQPVLIGHHLNNNEADKISNLLIIMDDFNEELINKKQSGKYLIPAFLQPRKRKRSAEESDLEEVETKETVPPSLAVDMGEPAAKRIAPEKGEITLGSNPNSLFNNPVDTNTGEASPASQPLRHD